MNVKSATRENNSLKVAVEVEKELFENGIEKAYQKLRSRFSIPGFRRGKAPRRMLENMYGREIFYSDAVEEIFPVVFKEAVQDQGWKAVGQPSVTDMKVNEDGSLELEIETDLYPEIELGQYKGIEVPKAAAEVSDDEVEQELDRKANEVARIITVDRPAQEGDTAVIDYKGLLDGVPFDGGTAEGYELRLGSHTFIPGFEEQVIGMSAGEEKDIDVTFPENYNAKELAGKAVVFQIKVHEVKETQVPAKDDDLAKDLSEFDTLEELRADIRANILREKTEGIDRAFENAVLEKAAQNAKFEIPASMIEDELKEEMNRFDYQLRSQGMSLEQYSKMLGGDLSNIRNSLRPGAENQLRIRMTLQAIAEAEAVEISEEEIEKEYSELAERYSMDVERIRKIVPVDEIKSDLNARKARDIVVSAAVAGAPVSEE